MAEQAEVNNMPASNLAIGKLPPANCLALNMTRGNYVLISVFGPTLLKTTEGSASLSSLVDTVHQTRVVELLTRYQKLQIAETNFFSDHHYTLHCSGMPHRCLALHQSRERALVAGALGRGPMIGTRAAMLCPPTLG